MPVLVRVWSAGLAGPQCPRPAPRAVSHAVTDSESGGDPVIDLPFLSVDAVGVDLQQHRDVVTEPPRDLGGGHTVVEPQRCCGVP